MTQTQSTHTVSDAPRIIVVDSSKVTRKMIARLLKQQVPNAEVVPCETGAEALDAMSTGIVDLVTTAFRLPDMDGDALSEKIRALGTQAYMPIIAVSGDVNMRVHDRDIGENITDYFDKSLGLDALAKFIHGYVAPDENVTGRVLYVEDSRVVALATTRMLTKNGLQAHHVPSVEDGLEILIGDNNQLNPEIDIVLTDVYLKGGMTGQDLLEKVRGEYGFTKRQLPILVMTGDDNRRNQTALIQAGANDLVEKPVDERILINKLRFQLQLIQP